MQSILYEHPFMCFLVIVGVLYRNVYLDPTLIL